MSGGPGYNSNPSMRKKTRGVNVNQRRGGSRPVPDKSVLQEGIYINERFLHMVASLVGCTAQIRVRNGRVYEGILRTSSPRFEVVLERAHLVDQPGDNKAAPVPSHDQIITSIIFNRSDIVTVTFSEVNLDYAVMDTFTDGAISGKCNGQAREKELEPWMAHEDDGMEGIEDAAEYGLDNEQKGWDPNEMFATNSKKFNIKSDYDPSLSQYTTPLNRADTAEYRQREEKAEQLAMEIERGFDHGTRSALENGDNEELAFSAVQRPSPSLASSDLPGQRNSSPSSSSHSLTAAGISSGKYVAPHMRSSQPYSTPQTSTSATPAQRPQYLAQTVTAVTPSGIASSGSVPTAGVAAPAVATMAALKSQTETVPDSAVVETRVNGSDERIERLADSTAPTLHQQPHLVSESRTPVTIMVGQQLPVPVAGKANIPKGHVYEELKQFQSNFKLSDTAMGNPGPPVISVPATVTVSESQQITAVPAAHLMNEQGHQLTVVHQQVPPPAQQPPPVEQQELSTEVIKKSVLNPMAKEFNPTVKATPPRVVQSTTPPRPLSVPPSPVSTYSAPAPGTQMPPPALFQPQPVFVPVQQQQQQGPRYQVGPQNKRVTVSARGTGGEMTQTPQTAIMTGAPLITQPVMQIGQPNMFQPQFFPIHSPATGYPPIQVLMRPMVPMGQHDPASVMNFPQIVSSQPGGVFLSQPVVHLTHPQMHSALVSNQGNAPMTSQHSQSSGVPHPPASGHQTPTPSQIQQYPMQQVLPPSASGGPQHTQTYHPLAQQHQTAAMQHQMVVQQQNVNAQSVAAPQSPQVAYTSVPLHYASHPGVMAYVPASQNAQLQQAHTISVASMSQQQSASSGGTGSTVQMTPVQHPPPQHLMMAAPQQQPGSSSQHAMHPQGMPPMQGGPGMPTQMILQGQQPQSGGPGGAGPQGAHQYVQAHQIPGASQGHLGMPAGQHMMFVSHHPMHQGPPQVQNYQHVGPQQ